jgi:hypothetical protein
VEKYNGVTVGEAVGDGVFVREGSSDGTAGITVGFDLGLAEATGTEWIMSTVKINPLRKTYANLLYCLFIVHSA